MVEQQKPLLGNLNLKSERGYLQVEVPAAQLATLGAAQVTEMFALWCAMQHR